MLYMEAHMNVNTENKSNVDYKSLRIDCEPDQKAQSHFAHGERVAEIAKCQRSALRVWAETSSLIIYMPITTTKKVVPIKEE
jgi:hypothetical protein